MNDRHEPSEIGDRKNELRRRIGALVADIDAETRAHADEAIRERLGGLPEWRDAAALLIYLPLRDEVATAGIIADADDVGMSVHLPRIAGETIAFHRVDPSELTAARTRENSAPYLVRHRLGMLEPDELAARFDPASASPLLVVCPGRAFDGTGSRLGRGGGHYDRFLAELRDVAQKGARVLVVGICYDVQIVDALPRTPLDVPMDVVVSETRTMRRPRLASDTR